MKYKKRKNPFFIMIIGIRLTGVDDLLEIES
jgi:hypothetical protein